MTEIPQKSQREILLMESPDRNSTGDIYLFKPELGKAMFQSEVQVQRRGNGGEMQEQK